LYSEATEHKSILATQSQRTVLLLWRYRIQKKSYNTVIQNLTYTLEVQSTKVVLQHRNKEQYLYSGGTEHKIILATQSYKTVLLLWRYRAQKYSCNTVIKNRFTTLEVQSTNYSCNTFIKNRFSTLEV